jgi:predicted DCC family thiol-disulfide oxidoreductase YuxK
MNLTYPLRIYYDDSCQLCRHEMFTLKAYDMQDRLHLVDCSKNDFDDVFAQQAGYTREAMMRLIHARDAEGQWLIGVPVFEAAYGAAGIISMQKLWGNKFFRPLWDRVYPWVADHRMGLSKLGVNRLFTWLVKRAAKKALAKTQACKDGVCEIR